MPESFNDRLSPPPASPKPARAGGSQGTTNAQPDAKGVAAGGLDSPRANRETYEAGSTRPETSSAARARPAIQTFKDSAV